MKILVCLKRVIDYNVHIRVKTDGSGVETQNVKMSVNPFDAIALEESLRIKENRLNTAVNKNTEIIAVSIGTLDSEETLRYALAMGADKAILIQTDKAHEPLIIARLLKQLVIHENPDLILMGKQAIDDDCNQTGQILAGLLNYPQGTFISNLTFINEHTIKIIREIDDGLETVELNLPAVITTDLRLNEPRRPTLVNIMKAKQKNIDIITIQDFIKNNNIDIIPHTEILNTKIPPARKKGIKLHSVQELQDILYG